MSSGPSATLEARLEGRIAATERGVSAPRVNGKIVRVTGMTLEAIGCSAPVGEECVLELDGRELRAEVVGFAGEITHLMPLGETGDVYPGAPVRKAGVTSLDVDDRVLGRIIDGLGRPLDRGPLLDRRPGARRWHDINPLDRCPIDQPLDVGVRAINSLFTVGVGQRVGLFAGSGVGKSVLLGMMARFTEADVVVVALIGEHGREVGEFVEEDLGSALARSVVVAAPADSSPVARIHGVVQAIEVAELFRAQGKNVLLLVDSLTRIAQARREIGLAMGEPPATKGYPPSAFSILPKVLERAGRLDGERGSITAFYTVLMEEDDLQDPVADTARAVLDGHLVLSRRLADAGHYPAIDVEASISRLHNKLGSDADLESSRRFRSLWSRFEEQRDLISVGAYSPGSDPLTDEAIRLRPQMADFLQQRPDTPVPLDASRAQLASLISGAVQRVGHNVALGTAAPGAGPASPAMPLPPETGIAEQS